MKIHAQEIFKRNVQFVLFIAMAVICTLSAALSLKAMSKANKPVIIGIDSNGTRIVSEASDPIYKTEAIAFIQKFFFNAYNFDSRNFFKRLGFATTMMSEDLWKKKESEIIDLKSKVERDDIALSGEILKLTKDEDNTYRGLVQIREKTRLNEQDHKVVVSLKLKSVPRTAENPFGLEVDSYEESIVRD